MFKRFIAAVLTIALCLSLFPVSAAAEDDSYTITTHTKSYQFNKGDVFTYRFWLHLVPDVENYLPSRIAGYDIATYFTSGDLKKLEMKTVDGIIYYDNKALEYVGGSAKMPNLTWGSCTATTTPIFGVLDGGTITDEDLSAVNFSCGLFPELDLSGTLGGISKHEATQFNSEIKVLVECKFRVKGTGHQEISVRTKLHNLIVEYKLNGEKELPIVDKTKVMFPIETYETVNDEPHTTVLKSLSEDIGFLVWAFPDFDNRAYYLVPGEGLEVTMMGASAYVDFEKRTRVTDGSSIVWFYDVPEGTYYVNTRWQDPEGNFYATKSFKYGEKVNVPATGDIQTMWLFAQGNKAKTIPIYINWIDDDGYLPVRPELLTASLIVLDAMGQRAEFAGAVIGRDETEEAFNYVNLYNEDGTPIEDYQFEVVPSDRSTPYEFTWDHFVPGEDEYGEEYFVVNARYTGEQDLLNRIPKDESGHYWEKIDGLCVEPTEEQDGYDVYHCVVCNNMRKEIRPFVNSHHWASWEIQKDATCTEPGTMIRYCNDEGCGEYETAVIPAKGHYFTPYETIIPATCTTPEKQMRTCKRCGTNEFREIEGSGDHLWADVCYEWNEDHSACMATRTCKRDATHTQMAFAEVKGEIAKEATCIAEGTHRYIATFNTVDWAETQTFDVTVPPTGVHTPVTDPAVEATCTTEGKTEGSHCSGCGEVYVEQLTIPKTSHVEGYVAPTCELPGGTTGFCESCKKFLKAPTIIPALGHDWSEWVSNNDATFDNDGTKTHSCHRCGTTVTEIDVGSRLTHHYGEPQFYAEATCTEPAKFILHCTDEGCEETRIVNDENSAPLGHAPVVLEGYPATCFSDGLTQGSYCSRCNATLTEQQTIPGGHKWGETVYTWSEDLSACSASHVCTVDPTHTETAEASVRTEYVAPTCEAPGRTTITATFPEEAASWTGTQFKGEGYIATGHNWLPTTYQWSEDHNACTATRYCANDTNLDHVQTKEAVLNITYDPAPTCESGGRRHIAANFPVDWAVQQTVSEDLGPLGHDWGEVTYTWNRDYSACTATRPCLNDRTHDQTCEASIATGHEVPATCTTDGSKTVTATFSAAWAETQHMENVLLPAGHIWESEYIWDKLRSCTARHWCTQCEERETVVSTGVSENVTREPGCEEEGEKTYTAVFTERLSWLDPEQIRKTEPIAPVGHDWKSTEYIWSEDHSTCTARRVCRRDRDHVERAEGVVTYVQTEPTFTEEGARVYTAVFPAEYASWTNPATDTVTIPKKEFDLADCEITLDNTRFVYDGSPKTPAVTVMHGDTLLEKDKDYTVQYGTHLLTANNINAGEVTVTITGISNCVGSASRQFTIEKGDQNINVTMPTDSIEVGTPLTLTITGVKTPLEDSPQPKYSLREGDEEIVSLTTNIGLGGTIGSIIGIGEFSKVPTIVVTGKKAGNAVLTISADGNSNWNSATRTVIIKVRNRAPGLNDPQINVSDVRGRAGEIVEAKVTMKNNPGISTMKLGFQYDETMLELVEMVPNKEIMPGMWTIGTRALWTSGGTDQSYNGEFLTLRFRIKEDTSLGTTFITPFVDDMTDISRSGEAGETPEAVDFGFGTGTLTVIGHIPGDVNGDQSVNTIDFMTLMKYHAGSSVAVNEAALDINGDGKNTALDITFLMKYLAGEKISIY